MKNNLTLLCIASFFKGEDFLRAAKKEGCTVYLVTSKKHEDKPWPKESIDDIFYIQQDDRDDWNMTDVIGGTAWLMQKHKIDRIVSLDDFDVEKGALMREHFRIPGMGQTTCRHFRDKLAMRMKASEEGINCPKFSSLFNDDDINEFIKNVPAPWVVKPRGEASAAGITKCHNGTELWELINNKLGNRRHEYLVEQFRPGDVYHADAITVDGKVLFCRVSRYLSTPMEVAHGGGIFRSVTVPFDSEDDKAIQAMNADTMNAFGLQYSASHTEFIKCHEDGKFYFLETASRVGGAHLAEMVEASSGLNLWSEWARVEVAMAKGENYKLPKVEKMYSGIIVSLSRYQWPDMAVFNDPEIVWKIDKEYHVGIIVKAKTEKRVLELLDKYADIVKRDFHASAPPKEKPTS